MAKVHAMKTTPPDENGQCPDGHKYVDEDTGCVPEWFQTAGSCPDGTTGTPPDCTPIQPPVDGGCPDGTTGTPPDCTPIQPPVDGGCPDGEDCPPPGVIPQPGDDQDN